MKNAIFLMLFLVFNFTLVADNIFVNIYGLGGRHGQVFNVIRSQLTDKTALDSVAKNVREKIVHDQKYGSTALWPVIDHILYDIEQMPNTKHFVIALTDGKATLLRKDLLRRDSTKEFINDTGKLKDKLLEELERGAFVFSIQVIGENRETDENFLRAISSERKIYQLNDLSTITDTIKRDIDGAMPIAIHYILDHSHSMENMAGKIAQFTNDANAELFNHATQKPRDLLQQFLDEYFVDLPQGRVLIGDPNGNPDEVPHYISFSNGSKIMKEVVTQGLVNELLAAEMNAEENPSKILDDASPQTNFSNRQAQMFAVRLNAKFSTNGFRLQTEEECESAMKLKPAGFLYGVVREHTRTFYGDYLLDELVDPKGNQNGVDMVTRGYSSEDTDPFVRRASYRSRIAPHALSPTTGFRLVYYEEVLGR